MEAAHVRTLLTTDDQRIQMMDPLAGARLPAQRKVLLQSLQHLRPVRTDPDTHAVRDKGTTCRPPEAVELRHSS